MFLHHPHRSNAQNLTRSRPIFLILFLGYGINCLLAQVVNSQPPTPTTVQALTPTPTNPPSTISNITQGTPTARPILPNNSTTLPTTTISSNASAATSTPTANSTLNGTYELPLDTKLTAPFGILGSILILSGAPMAFWGGRNRWSSYFLTGAYVAALIVMVPILRFGVIEQQLNPSNLVQGMFVLVCLVAAIGAGGVSVIFWKGTRYLIGAGGGFVIALFILSLRDNVLIRPPGLRWVMIIGSVAIGFILATIPQISLYVTVVATAAMGSAAVMIGVDCFTTGGLKEYWLYIVGFGQLFPKLNNHFPLTITMQAELGVMAALCLMGAAVQWRLLEVIHQKIKLLKQMDRERAMVEEAAAYRQSMALDADLAVWEKRYNEPSDAGSTAFAPSPKPHLHGRKSSQFSLLPRLPQTPGVMQENRDHAQGSQPTSPQPYANNFHRTPKHLLPGIDSGKKIADALGMEDGLRSPRSPQCYDTLLSPNSPHSPVDHARNITEQKETLAELEEKMKTLDEVRKMRVSVEKLRAELNESSISPKSPRFNLMEPSVPSKTVDPPLGTVGSSWRTSVGSADCLRTLDPQPRLSAVNSGGSLPRPQSMSVAIDFQKFGSERKVGRPPGAPISWTKRATMVDLNEPTDRSGRPLPLEDQERMKKTAQAPNRYIRVSESSAAVLTKPVAPARQSRVMTIEELDSRHKEAIKKLQATPGNEKMMKTKRERSAQHTMNETGTSAVDRPQPHRASSYNALDDRRHSAIPPEFGSMGRTASHSPYLPFPSANHRTQPGSAPKKDRASWLDY